MNGQSLFSGSRCSWLGANQAAAQGPAMPLSKAIVSDDVAKRTLMKMQINAATARAIVDACVEFARASNASYYLRARADRRRRGRTHHGWPVSIAVEAAELKAKTVLYARTSSSAVTNGSAQPRGACPG